MHRDFPFLFPFDSIIGTFSIIVSVIVKKQVFSPKVTSSPWPVLFKNDLTPSPLLFSLQIHPIFILSIADFLLACLWVAGGSLWLGEQSSRKDSKRGGCFVVLLATVVSYSVVFKFLKFPSLFSLRLWSVSQ